ncbi:hypothetical protein [Streptomyces triticirhizae]|uniref:hypothetical protein n=1 Tax=Streptomyces triticirhizae TaxID=2483353 RepID=UPI00131592BC|nr:hypothetical protein [Streptomyces triticirhizae]
MALDGGDQLGDHGGGERGVLGVEHAPQKSLLFNDLLHGVRDATAFAGDAGLAGTAFNDRVVSPPALAYMWVGAGEFYAHYDPLDRTGRSMVTPAHEVLADFGLPHEELSARFAADLAAHRAELARVPLLGEVFAFSLWLTCFTSGVIAGALFDKPDPGLLDEAFQQPWAEATLATLPASSLRKMAAHGELRAVARHYVPLCRADPNETV